MFFHGNGQFQLAHSFLKAVLLHCNGEIGSQTARFGKCKREVHLYAFMGSKADRQPFALRNFSVNAELRGDVTLRKIGKVKAVCNSDCAADKLDMKILVGVFCIQ